METLTILACPWFMIFGSAFAIGSVVLFSCLFNREIFEDGVEFEAGSKINFSFILLIIHNGFIEMNYFS